FSHPNRRKSSSCAVVTAFAGNARGISFGTPHLIRLPKGEALQNLVARSADALRFILERHSDETVVVVAHDSVNRALLMQLLDQPLSSYWRVAQDPCCINEIDIVGTRIRIGSVNETSHLDAVVSSYRR